MSSVPENLGRYRVLELLGSGAMGDVYLAEDPQIERRLAIKTVRLEGAAEDELSARRARLLMEAKAAGKLVHPNVVTLFDAGEEGGVVFLAFEYVEGVDLGKRLKQEPPLSLGEVLKVVAQTAEALDHAHRNGIVHRDIKPGNILLTPRGDAKIGDFGIAKMRDRVSNLTSTGTIVGTPFYMSPEQVRGETLDGRSDIFSLGSVLFEILHRARPFVGDTITTLVYQILHHDPIQPESVRQDLPPAVIELLAGMLSKDLARRYTSAREVANRAHQILSTLPAAQLDAPAYPSLEGAPTRASTPASVVPPPPAPAAATAPLPPARPTAPIAAPPSAPPVATAYPLPSVPAAAPPAQAATQPPATATAAPPTVTPPTVTPPIVTPPTGAPPATGRRGAWIAAVGCLAVVAVLGVGATVVVVQQLRERFVQPTAERLADGELPLAGPLPTPEEAAESTAVQNEEPAREDLPQEDVHVVVDSPPSAAAEDEAGEELTPRGPASGATLEGAGSGAATARGSTPTTSAALPPTRPAGVTATPSPSPPAARSTPGEEPRATEPDPEPESEVSDPPRPGPIAEPFSRGVESALAVTFRVEPEDTFILMRAESESRYTQIGQAADYDLRKRRRRPFTFPDSGIFYLTFRREGYPDYVMRVQAGQRQGPTVVAVNMVRSTSGAQSRSFEVREGVTFRGGPSRARVRVDGRLAGRLQEFSGGRLLRLTPGSHQVVVVIGSRDITFRVTVDPSARVARETITLSLR